MTILIVEDDKSLATALSTFLDSRGHNVHVVHNGLAAKETMGDHIDLILLDLLMPVMTGTQFHEWLRGEGHKVPVIVLSNIERHGRALEGEGTMFMDKYATKLEELLPVVQSFSLQGAH